MQFRYYITDLGMGNITGTQDQALAEAYATSEDNFVVDSQTGEWILPDASRQAVEPANDFREGA